MPASLEPIADSSSEDVVHRREQDQRFAMMKQLLDERAIAQERMENERFGAIRIAQDVALASLNKRLDGMNEFRQALSDQAANSVTRIMFDQSREAISKEIAVLRESITKRDAMEQGQRSRSTDQRASIGTTIGLLGGVVLLVSTVVGGVTWITARNGGSTIDVAAAASTAAVAASAAASAAANKRVDDMLQRMDALSQRLNTLQVPIK